jgi:hypothetical protein
MKWILLFLLFSSSLWAQSSKENRSNSTSTLMLGNQIITTWIPSKYTGSYTYIFNDKWSLEGEYSWASFSTKFVGIELGEISEGRSTLQARYYVSNSFHFSFGGVYSRFSAKLGNDYLDNLGNKISAGLSAENLGVTLGMGNRWQWSNGITLGVDWIRINYPLVTTKIDDNSLNDVADSADRNDLKDSLKTFNRIPTFVLFGLNVGYSF